MNTSRQLWTLLKFQAVSSPYVWVVPVAFCSPLFFESQFETSLSVIMLTQNLFLIVLFGGMILAPELFTSPTATPANGLGTEFLRSRAVDKRILARSRSVLFLFLAMVAPVVTAIYSLRNPDLHVTIFSKAVREGFLGLVPGSSLMQNRFGQSNVVAVANGNVLVGAWRAWEFLALAVLVQAALHLIYPFKYRRALFWVFFGAVCVAPLLSTFERQGVPWDQALFFRYAGNQAAFWAVALIGLVAGQAWCEWRFCGLEL